jgi:nickel-dependent lactate racemase
LKTVALPYGDERIEVVVGDGTDVLSAADVESLPDPAAEIRRSLREPIATPALSELARGCDSAAVVVSDHTRPVPYKEPNGILPPIIESLKDSNVNDIRIIVAYGTHRPLSETELRKMLGHAAFSHGVRIMNHAATDISMLRCIGSTQRTRKVTVNRHYLDAQLKIVTGLVEPHFMAGFSGGRKAICPGICGQTVTYGLHSAPILDEEASTTAVLDGNPCHEEALRIAKMAGVDFIVNVTIDNKKRMTGVFCGDLEKAHQAAVDHLCTYVTVPIRELYDIVIIGAGDVGVNHYQCAKAAFEACKAVKPGGRIVIVADLTDPDPVGADSYKDMLRLAIRLGPHGFRQRMLAKDWAFVPDQWQVQMWTKAHLHVGNPKRIFLCAAQLEDSPQDMIAETNVTFAKRRLPREENVNFTRRILQQTIDRLVAGAADGKILVLPDGPYAVPKLIAETGP